MPSYAIIETGSKQYWVEPQAVIEVEKLALPEKAPSEKGAGKQEITLDQVLMVREGDNVHLGTPLVKGAKVVCDFMENFRGDKVISLKYRRRKASRKKHGHRQDLMRLRVKEIKL